MSTLSQYFCNFAAVNRINWVDWTKCIAVTTVVFCHLPQSQEWIYYRYLQACVITIFFFLSGYLKRDRGSMSNNWHKYWMSLVVPYIIFNLLALPYWYLRYYLQQGMIPDLAALSRPIVGALLFQHTSSIAEPLNGALWYLPAILVMHLITDLCHRTHHEHLLMSVLCVMSFAAYYLYRTSGLHLFLTPVGFLRGLPFFYMGYVFGQRHWLNEKSSKRDTWLCVGLLITSILLFWLHMETLDRLLLHLTLYYPVNATYVIGVVYGCRLLCRRKTPRWVVNISIGTLVVIGLQWTFIGFVNYVLSHLTTFTVTTGYNWYEALLIALLITTLHYPIILWAIQQHPALLGRKKTTV